MEDFLVETDVNTMLNLIYSIQFNVAVFRKFLTAFALCHAPKL